MSWTPPGYKTMQFSSPLTKIDWLTLVILLIAGVKFTFGLEQALDITLYDESTYLWQGVTLPSRGFDQAQYDLLYAPLYTLWYYLLSLWQSNRIELYYLNFKIMTILPAGFIYLLLRSNGVSVLMSAVVSWLVLIATANTGTVPRVSHLALLIMLLVFIIISHTQSTLIATLVATVGALLISYARPEYFLTFLLLSLLLVSQLFSKYRELKTFDKMTVEALTLGISFSMLLWISFGSPVGGGRSLWAFQQHFAVNWVFWTNNHDLNPWTDAYPIFSLNFGNADSIWSAILNNPKAFATHLRYNAELSMSELLGVWFSPAIFPRNVASKIMACLLVIALFVIKAPRVYHNLLKYRWLLILSSFYLGAAFVSVMLIYPRTHYLLMPGILIASLAVILLTDTTSTSRTVNQSPLFYLLAILAFTPSPYLKKNEENSTNMEIIRFIASLNIQKSINMLETQGGYCYYLGNHCQWVSVFEKEVNFKQFLEQKHINMIVMTPFLNSETKFREDPEWRSFLNGLPQFGFSVLKLPKNYGKLLIHNSLVPTPRKVAD